MRMTNTRTRRWNEGRVAMVVALMVGVAVSCLPGARAGAAEAAPAAPAPAAPASAANEISGLQAEMTRLQKEVREQRQLIFQLMQVEQQHYEMLLKYLQSGGLAGPESGAGLGLVGGAGSALAPGS